MREDPLYLRAKELKLYGLMAHWEQLNEQLWPIWIDWEEQERAKRGLERRLSEARLGRFKLLADFDWNWPKRCDRQAINELMSLQFMNDASNIILVGPNGVGKSTIARNIAHQAVMKGHKVRFTTASNMLNDLTAQDGDTALKRRLALYSRPHLLVIDEVGYLSYSNRHADLLFEIVSRRYETRSTVITTNRPFQEWSQVFPNAACVVSLVDRLIHHSEIISIDGDSFRLKEAQERQEQQVKKRQHG